MVFTAVGGGGHSEHFFTHVNAPLPNNTSTKYCADKNHIFTGKNYRIGIYWGNIEILTDKTSNYSGFWSDPDFRLRSGPYPYT